MQLHIDLSRGKPCSEQLDISMNMLETNTSVYMCMEGRMEGRKAGDNFVDSLI